MKSLIKKDLRRLEKNTTADKPIQVMVFGEYAYPDKNKGVALMLIGKWKGAFKNYAKEVVTKDDLGAIGQVYFGGVGSDGQKIIKVDLAKGKGKGKAAKLAKGLKKLIPQATFNVVFGEMSETDLNQLETRLDAEPDMPEVEDMTDDGGEVEVDDSQDIQKLLDSNLVELSASLKNITEQVYPRLKSKNAQEGDADLVIDTLDLANEWLEMYREADETVRNAANNLKSLEKVDNIVKQVNPMLPLLDKMGVQPTMAGASVGKSISASVGNLGKNIKNDVIVVQTLLNQHGASLSTDGSCGKLTIAAILDFQKKTFGKGDGRVDVGGDTWKALVGSAVTNNTNTNPNNNNQPANNNNPPPTPPTDKPIATKPKGTMVGKGGDNHPEDVLAVQILLNKKMHLGLPENGICDQKTIDAIMLFQKTSLGEAYADGKISVAGGMTMAAGNITWKALRGSGRKDLGVPADVDSKVAPMGKTKQGLPDQLVICAPKTGDPTKLPVIIAIGGMHGYGGQFMVDCIPASLFSKAVIIGAGYNANISFLQKAYLDRFGVALNKGNASICGFSAGGNIQGYMSGFKMVGLIDPIASVDWAKQFSNKVIFSANSTSWKRDGIMPDVYKAAKATGATVEDTTVSHGAYPEYFFAKFGSKLL